MISVSPEFIAEVFENDNRSYLYRAVVTPTVGESFEIDNEYFAEAGGVVLDEAVSGDDSLDIGTCVINKATLTVQNLDGHWDDYDFRGAGIVLYVGLLVNGEVEEFRRGTYVVKEMPQYDPNTLTLTCYDYMYLFDEELVADVLTAGAMTTVAIALAAIMPDNLLIANIQDIPLLSTTFKVPDDQTMTCRELLSYIGQMTAGNFRFDENGKLMYTWYGSGYSDYTVRMLEDSSIRISEEEETRIIYPPAGEVVWRHKWFIPSLYSLNADRYDTVVTGVRIVINSGDVEDEIIDPETYVTGTDDYMISVENNPLITSDNASTVLACLAASLVGFRYRQASFSHPSMPWIVAGDSARVIDSKGEGHTVLISSTVFTSLDRQSSVSAGAPIAYNIPTRFSPETKAYVKAMEDIKPVVNTMNQKIANANGLYETTRTEGGATVRYLHNKANLSDSDIRIVISDVGVLMTADAGANWYGLTVDGNLIASILSVSGINADWINTGALTLADNGTSTDDPSLAIYYTASSGTDFKTNVYSWGVETLADASWGESWMRYSYEHIILTRTLYDSANDADNRTEFTIRIDPLDGIQAYSDRYENGTHISTTGLFNFNFANKTFTILGQTIALQSTPTFTAASGVTVTQQTWSKVGNIVTGDLTLSKNAQIGSTTTQLGTLSEKPSHTVIGNARTGTVQMRASINSSGVVQINSGTNVSANTTIYLTFTFVV